MVNGCGPSLVGQELSPSAEWSWLRPTGTLALERSISGADAILGSCTVPLYGEVVAPTGEYRWPAYGILGSCLHCTPRLMNKADIERHILEGPTLKVAISLDI